MKTIEEKAKAYDEALEQAKKELATCGSLNCDAARQIFRFFPELRESENNKMIRFIGNELACLRAHADGNHDRCVELNNALKWLYEQKEQKPTSFNEPYNPDEYEVVMDGNATSLKRKEQKPAEWSEEDERILKGIIGKIDHDQTYGVSKAEMLSFLKRVRPQVNPIVAVDTEQLLKILPKRQEWSEEDEDAVRHICRYLGYHCNEATARGCTEWLNVRLKYLRPQSSRKLSEDQIYTLERICSNLHLRASDDAPKLDEIIELLKQK